MDVTLEMRSWPVRHVRDRHTWIVAADIGQSVDPTAVCALEHIVRGTGKMIPDEKTKMIRQERVESFHVRHLERLPLGMAYPTQIQHVANLLARDPLTDAKFVLDYTGSGARCSTCSSAPAYGRGVLITAGNETTGDGTIFHVPANPYQSA
jgi:hypothetical protein